VAPQVQSALVDLNEKLQEVRSKLAANRASLEALRQADDQVRTAIDDSAKRAHVLGRISLFVESLPQVQDSKELEAMAASLRAKCASIEALVSDELVQERLSSILARLSGRMTKWASQLHLEHSEASLRLDIKRLTVVADTDDGAVPMSRMGSAANWVGYHLITHLALHEWFVKRNRPVPRFLFLDQPSQVYFPPEQDEDGLLNSGREEDRTAVIEMFRLVQDVVNHVAPGLQVVITEHADLTEAWYQDAVVHRWRSGAKLVPENWPRFTS